MFSTQKLVVSALGSTLLLGALGCESDNDDQHRTRHDRISDRRVDRYDRDIDRLGDRDDEAVLSGGRLSGIPRNARRVDSAQGTSEMMFRASRDATIYVYDADAERVVYTGSLRDGDRFVLDPNDNIALINGKKVLDKDLKSRHVFRLYVLEDRERALY